MSKDRDKLCVLPSSSRWLPPLSRLLRLVNLGLACVIVQLYDVVNLVLGDGCGVAAFSQPVASGLVLACGSRALPETGLWASPASFARSAKSVQGLRLTVDSAMVSGGVRTQKWWT